MDIAPAGYFNNGNATLTYGFAKDFYNVYWDTPTLVEDTHHFHVDEHLSDQTVITLTFTAERNGNTIVRSWPRTISNHLTTEKDLNSEYFPGLSHYYYTIGGLDEVTLAAGSSFTFDQPTFKTYRTALPKDYASITDYAHTINPSNGVISTKTDLSTGTITGTVASTAKSGDVCYVTAYIQSLLYSEQTVSGDDRHLKVIVQ
jgi:hypothetical protein